MTRRRARSRRLCFAAVIAIAACRFDDPYRQSPVPPPPSTCVVGAVRCDGLHFQTCVIGVDGHNGWATSIDCGAGGQVCGSASLGCTACVPGATTCAGPDNERVDTCNATGTGFDPGTDCAAANDGRVCRSGTCANLCEVAALSKSNVGCEYWPVQLDNANISASLNASAQQYAVVVSNPQTDVIAHVEVDQDESNVGDPASVTIVAKTSVKPNDLTVLLLGPRWVDGTTDVNGDGQTNSALSRHAYRLTSDAPIIAYQFNPFQNVNVFSNDASLLKPVEALGSPSTYIVAGWPQTIAISNDPATDFGIQLRNFLTIVGTRPDTHVTVSTRAHVVAGGTVADIAAGETQTFTLQPFEVLNLETGDFHADFTGSIVHADGPVVVYSGSEASDAPHWDTFSARSCCADHLEEQLDPARTAGRRYAVAALPNRTRAVIGAGATTVGLFDELEWARVVNVATGKTHIRTSLPAPDDDFYLTDIGDFREVTFDKDFSLESDGAIHVAQLEASQDGAGVPRGLPGGDPDLIIVPPIEQWRADYVFLTPDKYVFDFVTIAAPAGTQLLFDGEPFAPDACEKAAAAPTISPVTGLPDSGVFDMWRCQLSFPVIDQSAPSGSQVKPGRQNDGVHRLQASVPVGLIVYGFDSYVSSAYAGGTQLEELSPR
ncbi:MAG: hypothetical protein ACHREM_24325 [Polyangiales bacterium]